MNDKEFATKLRVEMAKLNVTTSQLSDETGISSRLINYYRAGERLPAWKNLKRIKNALGCDLNDLA